MPIGYFSFAPNYFSIAPNSEEEVPIGNASEEGSELDLLLTPIFVRFTSQPTTSASHCHMEIGQKRDSSMEVGNKQDSCHLRTPDGTELEGSLTAGGNKVSATRAECAGSIRCTEDYSCLCKMLLYYRSCATASHSWRVTARRW